MRKFLVLIAIIFLAVNFSSFAHSGCGGYGGLGDDGLAAGLEFGIDGINEEDERAPYLTAMLSYGHSFLNDSLDFYSELNYTFGFKKDDHSHGGSHDDAFPQTLYFNLMLGYNLRLGPDRESTLSFILQNEFDRFVIAPRNDGGNNITGIFTPAVNFNQEFNTGDLYAQIGLPITYVQDDKNADAEIGLNFTVGWNSLFGLELEATLCTMLAPGDEAGLDDLELVIGYEVEPFHFSVEAAIPLSDFDHRGIDVTPRVEYGFGSFNFYVYCEFAGIGAKESEHSLCITPALGFKFTF